MPGSTSYSADFFDRHSAGSRSSAQVIVPLVLDLLAPRSVIDVGCGLGTWLAVFKEHGVTDVYGIDGDYVEANQLQIPPENFQSINLAEPFELNRRFDLVVSVEVAEHLPQASAKSFVRSLATLGPAVLFSAAIPHQGGDGHVNEQWPGYWARLFDELGYVALDCVRSRIWENDKVEWWYAQNLLVFVDSATLPYLPPAIQENPRTSLSSLPLVHPRQYLEVVHEHERRTALAAKILHFVPPHHSYILVGMDYWFVGTHQSYTKLLADRTPRPFLERDGEYWGNPESDIRAVAELERMRECGAGFIAFPKSEWWWFEAYPGLERHLSTAYECCFADEDVRIFDLRLDRREHEL